MGEAIVGRWKEAGVALAQRRFPHHAHRIDALAAESATFREVCEALGDAEAALGRLADEPPVDARAEQWRSCILGLEAELEAMLGHGNVVPLRSARPNSRCSQGT